MTAEEYKQEAEELRPKLTREAMRYLHSREDAEDVVQDALVKLWNMLEDLHSPMARLAHILTRNLCIDHIRRHRDLPQLADTDNAQILNIGNDMRNARAQAEMIERMMRSIEHLPPKQQLVLRLRHLDGMSTADIAQLTGDNEAAIRQTLCRARQGVRKMYTKASNDE